LPETERHRLNTSFAVAKGPANQIGPGFQKRKSGAFDLNTQNTVAGVFFSASGYYLNSRVFEASKGENFRMI
jgi:hypothetical protein